METKEATQGRGSGLRVWVLATWVLGAAIYATLARGAGPFWAYATGAKVLQYLIIDRLFGLALLGLLMVVACTLILDLAREFRGRGGEGWLAVAWRLAALAYLIGMGGAAGPVLREVQEPASAFSFDPTPWRLKVHALTLSFGLLGVCLGLIPAPARRGATHRGTGLAALAAVVIGVLLLACLGMLVPYLVLIAMEAVRNAMMQPGRMAEWARIGVVPASIGLDREGWATLRDRIDRAGIEAVVGLLSCVLTAAWLGRDLRGGGGPRSLRGLAFRAATAAATWAIGVRLIVGTLPGLNPSLAEGFASFLHPWSTSVIAASFAALAGGMVARGLGRPEDGEGGPVPTPWPVAVRVAAQVVVGVVAVLVTLAAVSAIRGDETPPATLPMSLGQWLRLPLDHLTIRTASTVYFDAVQSPELLVLASAAVALAIGTWRAVRGRRDAPIDRLGRTPGGAGRFLGAWVALVGVMFTLFPSLFLAAMAAVDQALRLTGT